MTFAATDIPTSYVQREREALAGLESKLSDALDRRGKTIHEISRACAEAETAAGVNSARNSLGPLNKRARAIDSEIALIRINISEARRHLELAEAHAATAEARRATDRGETGRLVQLEISTPDGRVIRQFHKSVDAARKALQPGYTVTGEVIGGNIVSPIGPGARSFMTSLLDASGGELLEFLEAHGLRPVARDGKAA
jgi:septal ring factor EnvC (AmiA/AmiB activator)